MLQLLIGRADKYIFIILVIQLKLLSRNDFLFVCFMEENAKINYKFQEIYF